MRETLAGMLIFTWLVTLFWPEETGASFGRTAKRFVSGFTAAYTAQ